MSDQPAQTDDSDNTESASPRMAPADAPTWQIDIAKGAEVYTSDGEKLGTIKEIAIGYFKVDVRMHADYWLQREFVSSNADGRVTMSFSKEEAKNYQVKFLPETAVAQGQDGEADEKGDALGSQVEYVGGSVPTPEREGTNPASATINAAERNYERGHTP